jgi:hypothetical protein
MVLRWAGTLSKYPPPAARLHRLVIVVVDDEFAVE